MTEETIGQDRQSTVVRVGRGYAVSVGACLHTFCDECVNANPTDNRQSTAIVSSQLPVMSRQEFSYRACSLYRTATPIWHTKYAEESTVLRDKHALLLV